MKFFNWLSGNKTPSDTASEELPESGQSAKMESLNTNYHPTIRYGLWVLIVGFGGFLIWAAMAPLDAGVPSQGTVIAETKRKIVQHATGGVVEEILVREGDMVKANQSLIRLNDKQIKAQLASVRSQYLTNMAVEARLLAERAGKGRIDFPPELLSEKNDIRAIEAVAVQAALFKNRQAALQGEIAILREGIAGLKEQVKGLEAQLEAKKLQMGLLRDQVASLQDLTKSGHYPRNRLMDTERALADVTGQYGDTLATLARTRNQITELSLRILQRQQEFLRDVEEALTDVQKEGGALREHLIAAEDDLNRADIKAPADGMVVGLQFQTVGGVITPGIRIMDIAPLDEPLIIETRVPPHLIDKVHAGLKADVRFSAFQQADTPIVEGNVTTVSADLVPDQNPEVPPSYLVQVQVTPDGLKELGRHQIRTGMPVEVIIKTGERTLLSYLTKPFLTRISAAFKEQ